MNRFFKWTGGQSHTFPNQNLLINKGFQLWATKPFCALRLFG